MIEDTIPPQYRPPQAPRLDIRKVVLGMAGAVVLGLALTLEIRGWMAVVSEAGAQAGITITVVLLLFALTALVPLVGGMVVIHLGRGDLLGRAVAGVMVLLVPVGAWPGMALFNWVHGTTLTTVWKAPREPDSRLSGQGAWIVPGAVVRARPDRLISYDLATGRIRFTYMVPDPQLLCAMSRTAEGGIGLVAYGPEGGACQHVAALDLGSGRELWHQDLGNLGLSAGGEENYVSIAGDIAIVRAPNAAVARAQSHEGIQAFDLRTGALRWHTELTGTCSFESVGGKVTAVVRCVSLPTTPGQFGALGISYELRTYDPATGKQRSATPIPLQGQNANVTVLSYTPLVLHVQQTMTRGSDKVLVIGDDGRTRASIDAGSSGVPITLDLTTSGGSGVLATADYVITPGAMVVKAHNALTYKTSIEAYDMTDGHHLWSHSLGHDSLEAMTSSGDQAIALTETGFRDTLTSYRLSDGATNQIGLVQLDLLTAEITLFAQGKTYAIVVANGDSSSPVAVVK